MTSKLRKFLALPHDQKWLLTEALIYIFSAKILLVFFPLKTIMKISFSSRKIDKQPDANILMKIRWALRNADRLSFWKNRCLVLSIAGMWMLGRKNIPSQFSIGMMHDNNTKLKVHAWLKAGDTEIVKKNGDYYELYTFQKN
jgi:hypothetical protein